MAMNEYRQVVYLNAEYVHIAILYATSMVTVFRIVSSRNFYLIHRQRYVRDSAAQSFLLNASLMLSIITILLFPFEFLSVPPKC